MPAFHSLTLLQLGHARPHVETIERDAGFPLFDVASIGPRASARGNSGCGFHTRSNKTCFNWATRVRAWKQVLPGLVKRRAAGFNWATRVRAWKPRDLGTVG